MRIDAVRHEAGDGARRVLLAGVPGALQVVQNLLVQLAEPMRVFDAIWATPGNRERHSLLE